VEGFGGPIPHRDRRNRFVHGAWEVGFPGFRVRWGSGGVGIIDAKTVVSILRSRNCRGCQAGRSRGHGTGAKLRENGPQGSREPVPPRKGLNQPAEVQAVIPAIEIHRPSKRRRSDASGLYCGEGSGRFCRRTPGGMGVGAAARKIDAPAGFLRIGDKGAQARNICMPEPRAAAAICGDGVGQSCPPSTRPHVSPTSVSEWRVRSRSRSLHGDFNAGRENLGVTTARTRTIPFRQKLWLELPCARGAEPEPAVLGPSPGHAQVFAMTRMRCRQPSLHLAAWVRDFGGGASNRHRPLGGPTDGQNYYDVWLVPGDVPDESRFADAGAALEELAGRPGRRPT